MFRSRSWFGGAWGRPRKPHSLEQLKYLHTVLSRNNTVSESNRGLLVESLRCIAEILIWGDQNDSSVFDFFLEKNMLSYFLRIMRQRSGGASYVCVQLLQTLNILFENIRNETSLYYLLSNNHVNSIIVHKFDFSDEEVMAYYISFLKTLSLKLNSHTIHFFYNEHTKDFPLYTEAIKFFNHPESMVRIAVRTLTLNVYRVQDASMLRFIRDRTAAPYFSNLVWFIGKHILELDSCVRNDADRRVRGDSGTRGVLIMTARQQSKYQQIHQSQQRLNDLVAEHLDHLHYINDILCLNIPDLNDVLTEHLLHKLLIPLYIYSLTSDQPQSIEVITRSLKEILKYKNDEMSPTKQLYLSQKSESIEEEQKPKLSCVMALFLLSQVFLIITHGPIVHALAWIILQSDATVFEEGATRILEMYLRNKKACVKLEFSKPRLTLEKALESTATYDEYLSPGTSQLRTPCFEFNADKDTDQSSCDLDPGLVSNSLPSTSHQSETSSVVHDSTEDILTEVQSAHIMPSGSSVTLAYENLPDSPLPDSTVECASKTVELNYNQTDEEKQKLLGEVTQTEATVSTPPPSLENILEKEKKDVELKPFLKTILDSMDCSDNDYKALFALCLMFALINNKGVNTELLDQLLCTAAAVSGRPASTASDTQGSPSKTDDSSTSAKQEGPSYNALFVDKLMSIVHHSCKSTSKIRLVTVELSVRLLRVALEGARSTGQRPLERYLSLVEIHKNKAASAVRNYYKCDDIFLDMFEDEYCEMCKRPLNVEWLCMDAAILLPPTRSPMSGIELAKRLPSDEVERARRAIRTFFLVRDLYLKVTGKLETQLPLANSNPFVQVGDVLDLNDSDLISCDIIQKDGTWHHRFLAVDHIQIILVEPDKQRLGWGVAKLVGSLQDLEIQGDKEDPRCLHLTIHKPRGGAGGALRTVLLRAKFKFDDHIRSMAAKQRLTKGRTKSRQKKMQQIGRLLEVAGMAGSGTGIGVAAATSGSGGHGTRHRPLFTAGNRLPGYPAPRRTSSGGEGEEGGGSVERRLRRPSGHVLKDGIIVYKERTTSRERSASRSSSMSASRDSSPRPRSEEIPLEDIRRRAAASAVPLQPVTAPTVSRDEGNGAQLRKEASTSSASEETSFISDNHSKRRGIIETI